jgi:hypothetical protein
MPILSDRSGASAFTILTLLVCTALACNQRLASADAADLGLVSLYDGRRSDRLNTWGGAWRVGGAQNASLRFGSEPSSGKYTVSLDMGPAKAGEERYLQCFASGFGPSREYYQTRDLTPFARLEFRLQNTTHVPWQGWIQLKDYRDSLQHSAGYPFQLSGTSDWTGISVPLAAIGAPWQLSGQPDLTRILTIDFRFVPQAPLASGQINLTDVAFSERGNPLDIDTSSLPSLVERLACRQWHALWAARNQDHGMIPNNSYQSTDAGLNTTAAVLWMLPAATRRHWVEQSEADSYVALLVHTINRLLDRAKYLPPRNVDWVTLQPSLLPEESVVDAAFLELAFHRYRSLPSTSPRLRKAIADTQNRFDFASFACPAGWRMAYRYSTRHQPAGFTCCTYDGYTNESNLTSLAAHLSEGHAVSIERNWNSSRNRLRAELIGPGLGPIVHSFQEFRAPFAQALWNLFVDVRQRGVDIYPTGDMAVNPWQNFVCYEQNVMDRLAQAGRPYLVQPDAGDDGTLNCYRQFSIYDHFGQGDLFMPWSAAFPLLAGTQRAEASLRFLLRHQLHDPFGLADSAKWATGAAEPYSITARHDLWNTSLATMAFLEWLDQQASASRSFAALPDVRGALDRVFLAESRADGAAIPRERGPQRSQ